MDEKMGYSLTPLARSGRCVLLGVTSDGIFYTSFAVQPVKYLPWVLKKFQKNGGTVMERRVSSIDEIAQDYDVIVNCSGLGSYHLFNDKESFPVRGQVFRVRAPFAKMFFTFEDGENGFYVLPNQDSVVLGGTHQANDWDTRVRKSESDMIWSNLTKYLPCLKEAEILGETVGLRPGRPTIRVETEIINSNGKSVPVVHNYGHGGAGITLFYGCAKDAAELVVQAFLQKSSKL